MKRCNTSPKLTEAAINEGRQLARLMRSRAEQLAEPLLRNNLMTETPSEMLDRQDGQERFVHMIGRLLDLGFLRQVGDLRELIEWMRTEGSTRFPFESMRVLASPDLSGKRRVCYAPIAQNVFAEIFGVGNDSLGVIGRRWPEAFPPSNVEREAHATLLRSGIQRARAIMQAESQRRAVRVREGVEMLLSSVEDECDAADRAKKSTPEAVQAIASQPKTANRAASSSGWKSRSARKRANNEKGWISLSEAARKYEVSKSTLHRWKNHWKSVAAHVKTDSDSHEVLISIRRLERELKLRLRK